MVAAFSEGLVIHFVVLVSCYFGLFSPDVCPLQYTMNSYILLLQCYSLVFIRLLIFFAHFLLSEFKTIHWSSISVSTHFNFRLLNHQYLCCHSFLNIQAPWPHCHVPNLWQYTDWRMYSPNLMTKSQPWGRLLANYWPHDQATMILFCFRSVKIECFDWNRSGS